jgi:hypothetical protein
VERDILGLGSIEICRHLDFASIVRQDVNGNLIGNMLSSLRAMLHRPLRFG